MKILIIGGTRFIGRHIVDRLLAENHEIILFNRGITPHPYGDITLVKGDRNNPDDLRQTLALGKFDIIIDMIAYNKQQISDIVEVFNGHTEHYIMISTLSAYREPLRVPIYETDLLERRSSYEYGFHKSEAERELIKAFKDVNFPYTTLRLPAMYGEYDTSAREWYFIKRALDKRNRILLPAAGLSGIHREYTGNVAEQIVFLIQNRDKVLGQAFNSGHKYFQTCGELTKLIAERMNWQVTAYTAPTDKMPWVIPIAHDSIMMSATEKLSALGYVERYSVEAGLDILIDYFIKNQITDWIQNARQNKNLFDYEQEDHIIDCYGTILF